MSDWEDSENESAAPAPSPAPAPSGPTIKKLTKSKWEGEDEEDDGPVSDWEASSDEEEKPQPAAAASVAPPKKKGTLKAKLAEKEAEKAARKAAQDDEHYDEDAVLDPREKARLDRERELNADLSNAADLFGAAALGGTSSTELDSLVSAQPRTKEDFIAFSHNIIELIVKRHQDKPLYATFVENHIRELAIPLRDVEVRKAASALTTLANEKQREQRDKTSGKKKPKVVVKPALGAAKAAAKFDTSVYDEALDDTEEFM